MIIRRFKRLKSTTKASSGGNSGGKCRRRSMFAIRSSSFKDDKYISNSEIGMFLFFCVLVSVFSLFSANAAANRSLHQMKSSSWFKLLAHQGKPKWEAKHVKTLYFTFFSVRSLPMVYQSCQLASSKLNLSDSRISSGQWFAFSEDKNVIADGLVFSAKGNGNSQRVTRLLSEKV